MERMCAYTFDDAIADKLREHIQTLPGNVVEELKTKDGGTKFEFFGTMMDGVSLMGLGASMFSRV